MNFHIETRLENFYHCVPFLIMLFTFYKNAILNIPVNLFRENIVKNCYYHS